VPVIPVERLLKALHLARAAAQEIEEHAHAQLRRHPHELAELNRLMDTAGCFRTCREALQDATAAIRKYQSSQFFIEDNIVVGEVPADTDFLPPRPVEEIQPGRLPKLRYPSRPSTR
jgi:hypothetical protein